jgi:hypothetical protein
MWARASRSPLLDAGGKLHFLVGGQQGGLADLPEVNLDLRFFRAEGRGHRVVPGEGLVLLVRSPGEIARKNRRSLGLRRFVSFEGDKVADQPIFGSSKPAAYSSWASLLASSANSPTKRSD